MGRNATPKIGEWRNGEMYRFRSATEQLPYQKADNPHGIIKEGDGRMVVYEKLTAHSGSTCPANAKCHYCNCSRENGATVACKDSRGHLWVTAETLASAYADGLLDLLAAFWTSGYFKGHKAGRIDRGREIRRVLLEGSD